MSGYVRIHRSLLGHPAFRNESEAMAFAWLIAKAAWKATRVRYKGHSISLQRGQLAISQRDMGAAFDRDKAWIERLWKRLKSEAMIEVTTEAGVAVITISNYDDYQGDTEMRKAANEARSEAGFEAAARQRRGTEQGIEKQKNITPLPPKGGRGSKSVIPEDWSVPPLETLTPKARECAQEWPPGAYETHGEAFHAYWRSERRMKADWRLTWANRVIALHGQVLRDHRWSSGASGAGQRFGAQPTSLFEHKLAQKREAIG